MWPQADLVIDMHLAIATGAVAGGAVVRLEEILGAIGSRSPLPAWDVGLGVTATW